MNTATIEPPLAATAPTHVSKIGLKARDPETLARFYADVMGLREIARDGGTVSIGTGKRELLSIESAPDALPDDPREAGLFHTAFLLPERVDLARWLQHALEKGVRIDGASDHLVSEAIYLSDPEGNGIEIYVDRPREQWTFKNGQVEMATIPLDLRALLSILPATEAGWRGVPEGSVIGHVHLRVGDPAQAERWWHDEMGFDTMAQYGRDAVFLATGGYHHHIGANAWHSRGAGSRNANRAGLAWIEFATRDATAPSTKTDPWGTQIRLVPERA